jgi:hypothetical protein
MVRQFGYRQDSNLIRIDRVAVAALDLLTPNRISNLFKCSLCTSVPSVVKVLVFSVSAVSGCRREMLSV